MEGRMESPKEGDRVMLRPGTWPAVKIREWFVEQLENGKVLLRCPERKYTLQVIWEDIEVIKEGSHVSTPSIP